MPEPIGKFVQSYLPSIIEYCEDHPEELASLRSIEYSKATFKLNHAFFAATDDVDDTTRYWTVLHDVLGSPLRVTSQWFARQYHPFVDYLVHIDVIDLETAGVIRAELPVPSSKAPTGSAQAKTYPVEDAQNLLVRHILSTVGDKPTAAEWQATRDAFGGCCAYCGLPTPEPEFEHVIPINKTALGDNRTGNLVPSCKSCNKGKGPKDFRKYLMEAYPGQADERIAAIQAHQERHAYAALRSRADSREIQAIIEHARAEAKAAAAQAIAQINALLLAAPR